MQHWQADVLHIQLISKKEGKVSFGIIAVSSAWYYKYQILFLAEQYNGSHTNNA